MLKVAICEDSPEDYNKLASFIEKSNIPAEITYFQNGSACLAQFQKGQFHLIFMDIYMDTLSGIETAQEIRKQDQDVFLCFTTTSMDHTKDSYRLKAMWYLEKPLQEQEVFSILDTADKLKEKKAFLSIPVRGRERKVEIDEIVYIEVISHNCLIHTLYEIIDCGFVLTIEQLEEKLPQESFLRCHRSYIANLRYVTSIDRDFQMKNGDTVYIRRNDVAKCKRAWQEYLLLFTERETL